MMDYSDYRAAKTFIETKQLALMSHEKKPFAKTGFPVQNYNIYPMKGRIFYGVSTNIFKGIIDDVLIDARNKFPPNFGQGNAISILRAINMTRPLYSRMKDLIRVLSTENFCHIVENVNGQISNKILRVDLFRKIERRIDNKKKYEFTGGVFHALKHFSFQGKPLGTGSERNQLPVPNIRIYYTRFLF